jgi:phosphate transport system protein
MRKLHTDKDYETELRELREAILLMGAKVEHIIVQGLKALDGRDAGLAEKTIVEDRGVNQLELAIDERCLRILARRQPVASDLRFITMSMKLVTDLERMGDLGKNICERVVELAAEPPFAIPPELPALATAARAMVRDVLDAFVSADVARAEDVIARDSFADAQHAAIFRTLLAAMSADASLVPRASRVQSISKYLERIADHATNIGEMVVFMVSGRDIRHGQRAKAGLDEAATPSTTRGATSL